MFQQCSQSPTEEQQCLLEQFQLQKHICSQYIQLASTQLHIKQAHILSEANHLLAQLQGREKERVKDLSEWDVFSTRDSVIIEDQSSLNLSFVSQQSKGKLIQRKCALTSRNTKENQQSLNQCMAEIEKQCSNRTATTVKRVMEQYKKLKGRVFELQKKQKAMRPKQKLIEQLQEKNIILSTRLEDLQRDLNKCRSDCGNLKAENGNLMQAIRNRTEEFKGQRKIKTYQDIAIHQQPISSKQTKDEADQPANEVDSVIGSRVLRDLLEQKEHLLDIKQNQVKLLQQKIQRQLFSEQNRCDSCCQMLKKVKGSIIAYKKYLEQQGSNFEQLVDKFKERLLDQCLTS